VNGHLLPDVNHNPRHDDLLYMLSDGAVTRDKHTSSEKRTGLPKHIWIKSMPCCHPVNELMSTVASPHTVIALTQLKRASMNDIWYC